jgi:hypothetical protein
VLYTFEPTLIYIESNNSPATIPVFVTPVNRVGVTLQIKILTGNSASISAEV